MAASITLKNIADKYVKFVVENVDTVSKIESAVRFSSYLIPGILLRVWTLENYQGTIFGKVPSSL